MIETVWFLFVVLMLVTYVVLDGFDLGAGILHMLIGRTEARCGTATKCG